MTVKKRVSKKRVSKKRVSKKRVSKKRTSKKRVSKNPTTGMRQLYIAYVTDQDDNRFYYAGLKSAKGGVNDDKKKAVIFQSRSTAVDTVKYNIKSAYGASGLRSIGAIKTEIYNPKR